MSEEKTLQTLDMNKAVPMVIEELSIDAVKIQVDKIQQLMKSVMKEGEHFGVIPGTSKPSLLKPGAEKLGFTFRLVPKFNITRYELPNNHREYEIRCILERQQTGAFAGEGVGSCSTMESKYRYRMANKKCPECGKEAIIKGKEEYGGGWVCFKKKGGCGAKFFDEYIEITSQFVGQIENPDIADTYNTVLKMAKKRAHIDAMITACAASDIFTQDLEDTSISTTVVEKQEEKEPTVETKPNGKKVWPKTWQPILQEINDLLVEAPFDATDRKTVYAQCLKCRTLADICFVRDEWKAESEKRIAKQESLDETAGKALEEVTDGSGIY